MSVLDDLGIEGQGLSIVDKKRLIDVANSAEKCESTVKNDLVSTLGSPFVNSDSFININNKLKNSVNTFKKTLNDKGVQVNKDDGLDSCINKINNIENKLKSTTPFQTLNDTVYPTDIKGTSYRKIPIKLMRNPKYIIIKLTSNIRLFDGKYKDIYTNIIVDNITKNSPQNSAYIYVDNETRFYCTVKAYMSDENTMILNQESCSFHGSGDDFTLEFSGFKFSLEAYE